MKGVSLLVRIHLFASSSHTFAYHRSSDIELGLRSAPSPTNTSLGTLGHEDAVDSSALPAEHAGAVAEPEDMPVSTQGTEPQSTPSTTVKSETTLDPSSAQGAQIEDNETPSVHTENAQ